mmetsp:Transcript_4078/g.10938  ORF Transcript_4078/g.10938 Transcript_4078/m.10938 type:complete len:234 (-) Transcript_4078:566-1267(-)
MLGPSREILLARDRGNPAAVVRGDMEVQVRVVAFDDELRLRVGDDGERPVGLQGQAPEVLPARAAQLEAVGAGRRPQRRRRHGCAQPHAVLAQEYVELSDAVFIVRRDCPQRQAVVDVVDDQEAPLRRVQQRAHRQHEEVAAGAAPGGILGRLRGRPRARRRAHRETGLPAQGARAAVPARRPRRQDPRGKRRARAGAPRAPRQRDRRTRRRGLVARLGVVLPSRPRGAHACK